MKQANLASRRHIANFVNKTNFDDKLKNLNKKISSNKKKHVLVETELKKLKSFDSSLFIGQICFNNDEAQLYLIFQLSNEKFRLPHTTNKVFSLKLQ